MQRLDNRKPAPAAIDALAGVNRYLDSSSLARGLRLLLEIRISQINGCAYCVDVHTRQARANGEDPQRLDCLCVWREVPFFGERERAALAWAEALTLCAGAAPSDEHYTAARAHFEEGDLVDLTLIIAGMNAWNRIGVGFRPTVVANRADA
jgi:AhpD family alkylhydroperoxidase